MIKNNKYYDTDLAFKYAAIHGGFTAKCRIIKYAENSIKERRIKNLERRCQNDISGIM